MAIYWYTIRSIEIDIVKLRGLQQYLLFPDQQRAPSPVQPHAWNFHPVGHEAEQNGDVPNHSHSTIKNDGNVS